jgi:signal transduction histidine kinase
MIDKASNNTRTIAHNLMPPEFVETNLSDLLNDHIDKLNQTENVHFTFYAPKSLHPLIRINQISLYKGFKTIPRGLYFL